MEREVKVVVGQKAVNASVGSNETRQVSLQDKESRDRLRMWKVRKGKVLTGRSLIGEEWEAFEEAVAGHVRLQGRFA